MSKTSHVRVARAVATAVGRSVDDLFSSEIQRFSYAGDAHSPLRQFARRARAEHPGVVSVVNRFVCQPDPAQKFGANKINVRSDLNAESRIDCGQVGSKQRKCPWITRAHTLISLQTKRFRLPCPSWLRHHE